MKKKFKYMSTAGLVLLGLAFVLILACLFVAAPKDAFASLGASGMLVFGFAGVTGIIQDSIVNTRTLKYTHNAALSPGDPIVVNGSVLIAVNTSAADAENVFVYMGKVNLPKTNPLVINALDQVYWTGTEVNKTSAGNTACGFCVEAAASTDATVTILLVPSSGIVELAPSTQLLADPGNAGAIPVTASGHVELVTAGAETRTLAAPSFNGQMLVLSLKTDGGDCVVTCSTTVNQTGNNTITFNDAGDCVTLIAKQNGANKRWSVLANDGASLSTV